MTRRTEGRSTELRRALKDRFFADLIARGFVLDETHAPGLYVFRRHTPDVTHVLDLSWDKYGAPRFRVHLGRCPKAGIPAAGGGIVPPTEVLATWCNPSVTLRRKRFFRGEWYGVATSFWRRWLPQTLRPTADAVVGRLIELVPQLESYWATGAIGSNMKVWHTR